MDQIKIGDIVGIVYKLEKRIKTESSWVIFRGVHLETGEIVAVKMESVKIKYPLIPQEADMYTILQGGPGIPNFKWSGVKRGYNALVTTDELLGPSLEELFNYCNRRFSLKTVLMLADQLIQRVEYMHSRGVLHRDISPDNFLLMRNQVYIINYGYSKRYWELETHRHIPRRGDKNRICAARYATLNNIRGEEPSRRDDLESLGYVLILPWQIPNHGTAKEQYEKMCQKKFLTSIDALCETYPSAFRRFFHHCKSLKFEDVPNYSYLKSLFQNLYAAKGYTVDHVFDWNKMPSLPIRESTSRTQQVTRRLPQLSLEETSSEKVRATARSRDETRRYSEATPPSSSISSTGAVVNFGGTHGRTERRSNGRS